MRPQQSSIRQRAMPHHDEGEANRMKVTASNVVAWLQGVRIATLTATRGVPSLVEAIVGAPVKGSWWGHARGADIYNAAVALDASGEVLATKLVEGKVTFVHAALWPALYRVVTDPDARRLPKLDAVARQLLELVSTASGPVRLDELVEVFERKTLSRAAKALEAGLWVHSAQVHTEKGRHETVLQTWDRWADAAVRKAARRLGVDAAKTTLREALGSAKVNLAL